MKERIALCVLALCLLLAGCGGEQKEKAVADTGFESEEPMPGFDAQNQYMQVNAISFQETDGFFCGSSFIGDFVRYYDRASGVSGVLCADPACTHDSSSCGAYMRSGATLSYYDGKLYWIATDSQGGRDSYLYRGDLSGANREKVKRISFEDVIIPYQPQRYAIHRGNLYLLGSSSVVQGIETGKRVTLLSTPLDRSETYTTLFDETFDWGADATLRFVGDSVYLFLTAFPKGGPSDMRITRYDIKTGTAETVYEETGVTEALDTIWVTEQEEIYLSGSGEDHAYVWKLENGEWVEIASRAGNDPSAPEIMDGIAAYIYLDNGIRWIEIINLSGEPVYSGKLFPEEIPGLEEDPNKYSFAVVGGDADKIILNLQSFTGSGLTDYTLMLDLHDNLKPTVLWSGQK